jgi:Meiotically up-regulated gene 113
MASNDLPPGVTVRQVARRYRVSLYRVRAWIAQGELAVVVPPEALAKFERARAATAPRRRRRPPVSDGVEVLRYVYLMRADNGVYKVGRSRRVETRAHEVSASLPYDVELIHEYRTSIYFELEKALHDHFARWRVRGEWFKLPEDQVARFPETAREVEAALLKDVALTKRR